MLNGLLLVDKPIDWTSFDVVAKIRGTLVSYYRENNIDNHCMQCQKLSQSGSKHKHRIKVGHSGTLDPKATGLLVIAIGKATKQLQYLTKLDKVYRAELTLGSTSSTDDAEGDIIKTSNDQPSEADIRDNLKSFVGEIEQVPPIYSAIKINGQRAYEVARAGKSVDMKPRLVTIKSISDVKYNYPKLSFQTEVTSGTYIRSLARDIGKEIGVGAYLSQLRRLQIGDFNIESANTLQNLSTFADIDRDLTHIDK